MEDLLPILIGVIWLAITWYNKSQKKARKSAPAPVEKETTREPSILEQILLGQEIRISPPQESYYEPALDYEEEEEKLRFAERSFTNSSQNSFLNVELSGLREEGQSAFQYPDRRNEIMELIDLDELTGEGVSRPDFDLRKAVIYSEILNAPYIDFK